MFDFDIEEDILNKKNKLLEETRKNIGICEECKKPFEQGFKYNEKTGEKKFNKYKYCEDCRKNIFKESSEVGIKNVNIKYTPYDWQKRFHGSKARFKVVSGAARSGKDFSFDKEFSKKFIDMLNEERDYTMIPKVHGWIIGPTYKILLQIERNFMANFPAELVIDYDKDNHCIQTINGGLIEFRSADDPDSLVSVGLDIAYLTEAARMKHFELVISNIADRIDSPGRGPDGTGGLLLVNSSPRGRTFFNEVCKWGLPGPKKRPNWETFLISRWDNPVFADKRHKVFDEKTYKWVERTEENAHLRTYEEDLKLSRSERTYNEDILGIPSDKDGSQFPNFRETALIPRPNINSEELKEYIKKIRTPINGYTYSIGYDPAKSIDGAWIVVYCENTGEVVEIIKLENIDYLIQIRLHIKPLVKKWNYAMVRYGKTGVGETLSEIFRNEGIASEEYAEQGKNKEKLVENLSSIIKTGRYKLHDTNEEIIEILIRQFEDYGYSISPQNKTIVYKNMTSGMHDDGVSASYFAVAHINNSIEHMEDEFYDNNILFTNNNNDKFNITKNSFF